MPLGWPWMSFSGPQKDRNGPREYAEEADGQKAQTAFTPRRRSRHDRNVPNDDHGSRRQRYDTEDQVRVTGHQKQGASAAYNQEWVDTRRYVPEDQQAGAAGPPSRQSSITGVPQHTGQESFEHGDAFRTWQSQKAEMESIIKQRSQEAYQLELELQSANRKVAQWEESYGILQGQLQSANIQAEERIAGITQELRRIKGENQELRRVEKENQELRRSEKDAQKLRDEGVKLQQQLEQLTIQSERRDESLQKSQKLLESRTEELRLAQTFLTTADQHSIADICHMVDQLNEEIYQCTMMMSDALIEQRGVETQKGEDEEVDRQGVCKAVERRWGTALVSRVQADVGEGETTLFESMLQHLLLCRCYEIVKSFSLESREFDNRFLALWDSIRQGYEPPIAKRWLAITHSQLKSPVVDHSGIMKKLSLMMTVGGWRSEVDGSRAIPQMVFEKVGELSKRASKVKEAITEGILSAEVDVFYYEDGVPFDASKMQDAWDIGSPSGVAGSTLEAIICSTGLGLRCITRQRSSSASGHQMKEDVVLKPKVLLPSALEAVD